MKEKIVMLFGVYLAYASHQTTLLYLSNRELAKEHVGISQHDGLLEERLKEIMSTLERRQDGGSLEARLGFTEQDGRLVKMLGEGTEYETPAYFLKGVGGGKTAFIMAPHGDETAAWMAADDISRWELAYGNIIIIPRADRKACEKRIRSSGSDLNRQFGTRKSSDPAYALATEIRGLIGEADVDLVLNLHEGHGYYLENKSRFGQTIVTDSEPEKKVAEEIVQNVNRKLSGRMKFTPICKPMETTLTYYSMSRGIPAYGLETSKNLDDMKGKELMKELVIAFLDRYEIGLESGK
jgi:predicted deacylase